MLKFPKADADSDGVLSTKEKYALLNMAAQKKRNQIASDGISVASTETTEPEEADSGTKPVESPVRRGPQLVKPGEYGIGKQIEQLLFKDINGQTHSLSDFADQTAIVFAMTGTGCPLCLKYAPTLANIERQYRNQSVKFIFVNPNQSEQLQDLTDAVQTHGFRVPYVQDANRKLPLALKANTTTEVFVLDRARTLVYQGAVDDQYGFGYALQAPRRAFLVDALDAVLEGRTPAIQATTSPGCELSYQSVDAAETPITYHNRISRIIQANCLDCHRTGGTAPMAFERYDAVKDYAGMIADVVERKIMPPWFAAPTADQQHDGPHALHWANDRSLSAAEKDDLMSWINGGVPEGDPADKPLTKHFPDGWLIGKPDATFRLPHPIEVKATGTMPYQYATVETNLPEDKWVKAIEIRPSALDVVHHVIVSIKSESRGAKKINEFWAGYAPGNSTWIYPDGYARRLPKGAKLRFEMHYTPNGRSTQDQTQIGLTFSEEPPRHEVKVAPIANRKLSIPAGAANHEVFADLRLPYDAQILSFLPHMHLRGKAARYELLSGTHAKTLLDVPHYDFNWQLLYRLAQPLSLQRGDTIRFTGWFDNSSGNPANPDPMSVVQWGEQTDDEMHVGYIEYVVADATPGEPMAAIKTNRSIRTSKGRSSPEATTSTLQIGGRSIPRRAIANALRKLDRDNDGRVLQSQVPDENLQIFRSLDANEDGVVTEKEVKAAIQ
ncbi:MAG: redoxin family protein [Planctomycetaceae bacterium]|nr:redoxin family protein [Planctomycetaceae bacterium]